MNIDFKVFECWVGKHTTQDSLIRNVIEFQYANTGSHLFHPATEQAVKDKFAKGDTVVSICSFIMSEFKKYDQIAINGAVKMAHESGTKYEPFHLNGWLMQGGPAAAAIIGGYCNDPKATLIVDWIVSQQITSGPYAYSGLWHYGDKTTQNAWTGYWEYASDYSIPFEDGTQIAHCCALHAFGRFDALKLALQGIVEISRVNSGAIPYVASKRDAEPVWGRAISPKAYSVEQTTRVVQLLNSLQSFGPFDLKNSLDWIAKYEIVGDGQINISDFNVLQSNMGKKVTPGTNGDLNNDGLVDIKDFNILTTKMGTKVPIGSLGDIAGHSNLWYDFVDFKTGKPVYPLSDPNNNMNGVGKGVLTFDRSLSVKGGFDSPTQWPIFATAIKV